MMRGDYTAAIEKKAQWLRWAESGQIFDVLDTTAPNYKHVASIYTTLLRNSDTYFMNPQFCRLVDQARMTVPDDLKFERPWMQSKCGFIWCAEPWEVPPFQDITLPDLPNVPAVMNIRAVAWMYVEPERATQFATFMDRELWGGPPGFGCWSYFSLRDGDAVLPRVTRYEQDKGSGNGPADTVEYVPGRVRELKHEIRWTFTALHLMSQKLAVTVHHAPDRAARRRAEKEGRPVPPALRVITLRKMEEARAKESHGAVDWQWQWAVTGHWRNQWFPGEGVHKPVWIESYVKGPDDKPLKPTTYKLYVAER